MKISRYIITALCFLFFPVSISAHSEKSAGKSVEKYSLKNNIPVYYVKNTNNSIDEVSIIVKGGRTCLKPEESGLEQALFTLMSRCSSKYDYAERQQLSYEKSAAIFHDEMNNASSLSLQCINYYLKDLLPVLTDGFMKPVFDKQVYKIMMTEFSQSIQSRYNDPWSLLNQTVSDTVYKGHPYEADTEPNVLSLENITIEALKNWHKTVLDSRRICIIAVCSMEPEELISQLNSSVGSIKALDTRLPELELEKLLISGEEVVMEHPSATGSGYAVYVFPTPSNKDDDYLTAKIAAGIYSTTLSNIVRAKYGACYSAGTATGSGTVNYGFEYFYMISNFSDFSKYAKEARNIMASGKYISKLNDDGSYEFTSIEEVLEGTKNTIINSIYNSATSTGGLVAQYCSGLIDYDDLMIYDSFIEKIHSISANEVIRVFKKYWVEQQGKWFAVVGPSSKASILLTK